MKALLIGLGFLCVAVGAVGVVVPVLPTTPFLLLASYFFAKGSKRFHDWFLSTRLYKRHLESFVESRAMTLKSKLSILLPVSALLILTFFLVDNLHVRILLVVLFLGKYLYFFTRIRTVTPEEEQELKARLLRKKAAEAEGRNKSDNENVKNWLCEEE